MVKKQENNVHLVQFDPRNDVVEFDFGLDFGDDEAFFPDGGLNLEDMDAEHLSLLPSENLFFKICDGEREVGDCAISIYKNLTSFRGKEQKYPDSWFENEKSDKLLPILEVDVYNTLAEQRKGYGRLGYQKIYELSLDKGCGGRIITEAAFKAGGFYDKLGLQSPKCYEEKNKIIEKKYESIRNSYKKEGLSTEEIEDIMLRDEEYFQFSISKNDGTKYFDPTPESLAKLYKSDSYKENSTGEKIEKLRDKINSCDKIIRHNSTQDLSTIDFKKLKMYQDKKTK